jgi:hypothetical protein
MPDDNRISAELAASALTTIQQAVQTIRTNMPFLLSLTNEERRSLPKLGDNRLALDEDASALMGQHPQFIPAFVDMAELAKDRALRIQVDTVRLSLEALLTDIEGTEMVLGSEMLMVFLAYYANAKEGAKRGVAGAQTVVDTLGKYFARSSRTPAPAAKPTTGV